MKMTEIEKRKAITDEHIVKLKEHLSLSAGLVAKKACVYATGSYGRGEANDGSDLDLFIVSKTVIVDEKTKREKILLSNLDKIRVQADLIRTTEALGIKEFDGDGKYLDLYSSTSLTNYLGHPEDDARNTLTARLLLLLESAPILENDVYNDIIDDVLAEYWKDYANHSEEFKPAYLVNDILRLWRTFCVNYEART